MNIHGSKRLFVVTAVLGAAAVLVMGFFVALEVRSVGAGPDAAPPANPDPPSPGHSYDQIELPAETWPGLDADKVDGMHAGQSGTNYIPYADASGNVGIGTTTPVGKLQIEGDFSDSEYRPLRIKNTDTGDFAHSIIQVECSATSNRCQPGIDFIRPSGTAWEISIGAGDYTTDFLGFARFDSYSRVFMVLAPSGNVGVGTTSPNAKLQVAGGDAYIETEGKGLILRATDGSNCYRVTVNNAGTLGTALVSCP